MGLFLSTYRLDVSESRWRAGTTSCCLDMRPSDPSYSSGCPECRDWSPVSQPVVQLR